MNMTLKLLMFSCALVAAVDVAKAAGCVPSWSRSISRRSFSGTAFHVNGVNDVGTCMSKCSDKTNCLGFDFKLLKLQCWLITNANDFRKKVANSGIDQYTITRCPASSCQPVWMTIIDAFESKSDVKQRGIVDLDTCKSVCVSDLTCIGINWIAADKQCWFVTNQNAPDISHDNAGSVVYVIQSRCQNNKTDYIVHTFTKEIRLTNRTQFYVTLFTPSGEYGEPVLLVNNSISHPFQPGQHDSFLVTTVSGPIFGIEALSDDGLTVPSWDKIVLNYAGTIVNCTFRTGDNFSYRTEKILQC